MRFIAVLALLLGLSAGGIPGSAQALTLFETETGDCFCSATSGGTIDTTLISGFLEDGDEDYYRFNFAEPVPHLFIRPASPDIARDDSYRRFNLGFFQEVIEGGVASYELLGSCFDCWYDPFTIELTDLPAGTYYVGVTDFDFLPLLPNQLVGGSLAGANDSEKFGLGAYTVSISTPEPASLALFGTAIAGIALRGRRRTAVTARG